MSPGSQPLGVRIGLRQLNTPHEAEALDDGTPSSDLAVIAARWDGIAYWEAPLRNPMWIERDDGRPVAAVTGSFDELVAGQVERQRQAIAHAPDDVRMLLQAIADLQLQQARSHRRRGMRAPGSSKPSSLSAA